MNPNQSLPIGTYGSRSRHSAIKSRQAGAPLSFKRLLSPFLPNKLAFFLKQRELFTL